MKIGMDVSFFSEQFGGLGTYSVNLLKSLVNIGQDEIVAILPNSLQSIVNLPLNSSKVHVHPVDYNIKADYDVYAMEDNDNYAFDDTYGSRYYWDQVIIPDILDQYDIDVYFGSAHIIPLKWDGPKVVTVHDRIFELSEKFHGAPNNYFSKWARLCAENSDAIITVSEYTAKDISKNWNIEDELIIPIHLAPALEFIPTCRETSKRIVKDALGIKYPYLLHTGGWARRKNLFQLIIAYSMLKSDFLEEEKLVVVSDRNSFSDIILDKLNLHDHVIFTGYVGNE